MGFGFIFTSLNRSIAQFIYSTPPGSEVWFGFHFLYKYMMPPASTIGRSKQHHCLINF